MKNLFYFLIKQIMRVGFVCYFKKVQFIGLENVPKNKPVIFLPNHQNALIDPLLMAVYGNRKPYFLTRSDVFANSFLKGLFGWFRMLPIYRIRDGRDTLGKNQAVFDRCVRLLCKNEALVMFPEADHNLKRRVRPLSKGFTRIVFNALEQNPELDLRLVPVGVNYTNAADFPDSAALYFGKDIEVLGRYNFKDPGPAAAQLKGQVFETLKQLTTHIENGEKYEESISLLNALGVDYLKPQAVNALIADLPLEDESIKSSPSRKLPHKIWDGLFVFFNFPVILLWKWVAKKRVSEIEFRTTVRFLYSLFFLPIFYVLLFLLIGFIFNHTIALITVWVFFVFNLMYVKCR